MNNEQLSTGRLDMLNYVLVRVPLANSIRRDCTAIQHPYSLRERYANDLNYQ